MEQIMSLLEGFDLAKLLPELQAIFTSLHTWVGLALILGPAVTVIYGVVTLVFRPREANHRMGFRTYFGMGSVEAWRFSQFAAGIGFCLVGIGLGIFTVLRRNEISQLEIVDYALAALEVLLIQLGVVLVLWLILHLLPAIFYNRKGLRRWGRNPKEPDQPELVEAVEVPLEEIQEVPQQTAMPVQEEPAQAPAQLENPELDFELDPALFEGTVSAELPDTPPLPPEQDQAPELDFELDPALFEDAVSAELPETVAFPPVKDPSGAEPEEFQ